ncbi:MAG: aminopeptidase [Pseudomonadota bacterium]|mgnify:CR=1 FL=1
MNTRRARWVLVLALFAGVIAGCSPLRGILAPSPGMSAEWAPLLEDVRVFVRRIGFEDTENFLDLSVDQESFPFCGYASSLHLPYSYEDPAIRWVESVTEQECRKFGQGADVYFGAVEALGEVGTPVTPSMITGKLDRFVYLVIHEDCHDQFELPYGIEEALCNLITYKAMAVFAEEKFKWFAGEGRAIRRYAEEQSRLTRETITHYEKLAALYARFQRGEIAADVLMRDRAVLFSEAERPLAWTKGALNNVSIANDMTYSRHYPFLESVFDALGRDLARTVAFFRHVDEIKPSKESVMQQQRIADESSVQFIRAYEAAVMETISRALPEKSGSAGRR